MTTSTPHTTVTDLLLSLYASFGSGDASAWLDNLADDVLVIGTDDEEWFHGKAACLPVLEAQLTEMSSSGIHLEAGDPLVVSHEGWFWVADRPVLHRPDGSTVPLRTTVAGALSGDVPTIEHLHLSLGAANEDVVQQELTV